MWFDILYVCLYMPQQFRVAKVHYSTAKNWISVDFPVMSFYHCAFCIISFKVSHLSSWSVSPPLHGQNLASSPFSASFFKNQTVQQPLSVSAQGSLSRIASHEMHQIACFVSFGSKEHISHVILSKAFKMLFPGNSQLTSLLWQENC